MTLQRDDAPGSSSALREAAVLARLEAMASALPGTGLVPSVDEEFRRTARQRLVAMAAVRSPQVRPSRLRRLLPGGAGPRWRNRVTAGLAGAAVAVTALGGLVAASQGAGPGDLLYDVKRGGERTQLALAGDSSRGPRLLGFASTRLQELTELTRSGATALPAGSAPGGGQVVLAAGPDPDLVVGTLRAMDRQTTEGTWWSATRAVEDSDPGGLEELSRWATGQQRGLADVSGTVPARATDAASASARLLTQVLDRADGLRTALRCAGGPATAGSDALGPVPAVCPAAPPVATGGRGSSTGSATDAAKDAGAPTPAPLGRAPRGSAAATGAPGAGTAPPAATAGSAPVGPSGSAGTAAGGRAPAATAAPSTRPGPGGLPLPTGTATPATTGSGTTRPVTTAPAPVTPALPTGPLIDLPPVLPGVTVCVPPLLGIGCR